MGMRIFQVSEDKGYERKLQHQDEVKRSSDLQLKLIQITRRFQCICVSGARPVVSFQILDSQVHQETLKEFQTPKKATDVFFCVLFSCFLPFSHFYL